MAQDYADKVAKALAKAEDQSIPEEERQSLIAWAARIMQEKEIADEEVRIKTKQAPEEIVCQTITFSGAGGHGVARALALGHVVYAMGAQCCYDGGTRTANVTLTIVAHKSTYEHISVLAATMTPTMEALGNEMCRGMKGYERCTAFRSYLRGFGVGVGTHFEKSKADAPPDSKTPGAELILQDRSTAVQEAFQRYFPSTGRGRRTRFNSQTYNSGRAAGAAYGAPAVSSGGSGARPLGR